MIETARRGDWMPTYSGLQFWPLDPRPEDVRIGDIAHSLSQQPRFSGHLREFYSVGQHSWLVSCLCDEESREAGLYGLLHDASEAYLMDLIRPLKRLPDFAFYREAEERLQRVIYRAFGLDPDCVPEIVKEMDERLLSTEVRQLIPFYEAAHGDRWQVWAKPLDSVLCPFPPERSERLFLGQFRNLT